MNVFRGLTIPAERPYPVATIGNFDGQHRGHRSLLDIVVATARRLRGTAVVVTFDPHPVKTLAPHFDLKFLTSPEESWLALRKQAYKMWYSSTLRRPSRLLHRQSLPRMS
jgi:FAD synthase